MFVLNTYILQRMGWNRFNYFNSTKLKNLIPVKVIDFLEDQNYFILRDKKLHTIKQIPNITYKAYNFISVDFTENIVVESIRFESNIDLLKLIREKLACDLEYQRYFQINSIIKNNK